MVHDYALRSILLDALGEARIATCDLRIDMARGIITGRMQARKNETCR